APGTKLAVYSFNHTTGMLEITGTATVSADGRTVTTDPDSGITHPGWFGVTPPGDCGNGSPPDSPPPARPDDTEEDLPDVVLPFITGEHGTLSDGGLTFNPPSGDSPPPPPPGCDPPPEDKKPKPSK